MVEKLIIITNNIKSQDYFNDKHTVVFIDGSLMDILIYVRDKVHLGYRLLTHPLMGSVKPNQTPYKTVAISYEQGDGVDMNSLEIIENSIHTSEKLIKNRLYKNWPDSVLEDFRVIDFDLIYHALKC